MKMKKNILLILSFTILILIGTGCSIDIGKVKEKFYVEEIWSWKKINHKETYTEELKEGDTLGSLDFRFYNDSSDDITLDSIKLSGDTEVFTINSCSCSEISLSNELVHSNRSFSFSIGYNCFFSIPFQSTPSVKVTIKGLSKKHNKKKEFIFFIVLIETQLKATPPPVVTPTAPPVVTPTTPPVVTPTPKVITPTPKTTPKPTPTPPVIKPFPRTYEAEDMAHIIGFEIPGGWRCTINEPTNNYMVYGPYVKDIPKGRYTARFKLRIDNNDADTINVCTINVNNYDNDHQILAERTLKRTDFSSAGKYINFDLTFNSPGMGNRLEFRVFYHCCSQIDVDKITIYN